LAIKQQEQSAYQALLSNPLRLAKMRKDLGVKPGKDKDKKREKEERKRLKRERKLRRETEPKSRSPSVVRMDRDRSPLPDRHRHSSRPRSLRYYSSSRSPSPVLSRRYDDDNSRRSWRYSPDPYRGGNRSHSPMLYSKIDSEEHYRRPCLRSSDGRRDEQPYRQRTPDYGKRSRSPSPRPRSPARKRVRTDRSPLPKSSTIVDDAEARNARLAAMASNASSMSADRQQRLAALLEKEKAELEADEQARAKSKGMSGFLSQEQKRVFGGVGGLEDRIRRGRGGMVVDAD